MAVKQGRVDEIEYMASLICRRGRLRRALELWVRETSSLRDVYSEVHRAWTMGRFLRRWIQHLRTDEEAHVPRALLALAQAPGP